MITLIKILESHKKKLFMQKISVRSFPIYHANLVTFVKNWTFGRPKCPFWTSVARKRDMKWDKILRPSLFSAHCPTFMLRWSLLRGGVCTSLVMTGPWRFFHFQIKVVYFRTFPSLDNYGRPFRSFGPYEYSANSK